MKLLWRSLIGSAVLASSFVFALAADGSRSVSDLGLKLIWIKPGAFDMGTRLNGNADYVPITHVTFSHGFWLGQTEVTQPQWQAIIGDNPSDIKGDNLPVQGVDWGMAMKFCKKLTERERAAGRLAENLAYTLPTEAQWEYASRAGRTGYDIGMIDRVLIDFTGINLMSWNTSNADHRIHPVAQKKPNAWGFYDMQGNVMEWCVNSFEDKYPGGNVTDPVFTPQGGLRYYRGGSYGDKPSSCTSTDRWMTSVDYNSPAAGFRVALCLVQ